MKINKIVQQIDLFPEEGILHNLKNQSIILEKELKSEIRKQKIKADVFIGGSYAKGTLLKSEEYDVDLFVRFDWRYEDLSTILEKIVKNVSRKIKRKYIKLHGSRDYFRFDYPEGIFIEVIPVLEIRNPRESRNITDLSYFHVRYINSILRKKNKLRKEILLAKAFCKGSGVYGAESYIKGFSGYGLECLIIAYGSFEKMIRSVLKEKGQIILDPEKMYKNKADILLSMNESRLQCPIVLVDPTWKERNVLSALNQESFNKFKEHIRNFLVKPEKRYFERKPVDIYGMIKEAKKRKEEFVIIELKTDKQEGDIAGTKLKKFSDHLIQEIQKTFFLSKKEFLYSAGKTGILLLVGKSKKEVIRIGPPASMKEFAINFKKNNKNTFVKNGVLHAKIKITGSLKDNVREFYNKNKAKVKEMYITGLSLK